MATKGQIAQQQARVRRIFIDHGLDDKGLGYTLYALLVLKAMHAGNEYPNAWAEEQFNKLDDPYRAKIDKAGEQVFDLLFPKDPDTGKNYQHDEPIDGADFLNDVVQIFADLGVIPPSKD